MEINATTVVIIVAVAAILYLLFRAPHYPTPPWTPILPPNIPWTPILPPNVQKEKCKVGCYKDGQDPLPRAIPTLLGQGLTAEQCFNVASAKGHTVYGLQFFNKETGLGQCWGSNKLGEAVSYGQANPESCSIVNGELVGTAPYTNAVFGIVPRGACY